MYVFLSDLKIKIKLSRILWLLTKHKEKVSRQKWLITKNIGNIYWIYLKISLKNQAISHIEIKQLLKTLRLNTKTYMRESKFITNERIVSLHPIKGSHWVIYKNQYYIDSYGRPSTQLLTNYINERSNKCVFSERKIQADDSFCAASCLYTSYFFIR